MITPREVPDYLLEPEQFIDKNVGEMLLARWGQGGEYWLFFWNDNYQCWTSYRKATQDDVLKVASTRPVVGLV